MESNISTLVAFVAGLVSFLSPCVLPLVPVYITYLAGGVNRSSQAPTFNWRLFKNALGFISGFSLIFILLGASATYLGRFLLVNQAIIRKVAGVVIVLFGFQTLGVFKISLFQREWRPGLQAQAKGQTFSTELMKSFSLGLAFGFGWTPCIGPVLGSILAYASTRTTLAAGIWLLTSYSLGLAMPFLTIALTLDRFGKYYLPLLQKYLGVIKVFTGVLLVILGLLVYFNLFSTLASWS